jgi:hypothetical protein
VLRCPVLVTLQTTWRCGADWGGLSGRQVAAAAVVAMAAADRHLPDAARRGRMAHAAWVSDVVYVVYVGRVQCSDSNMPKRTCDQLWMGC